MERSFLLSESDDNDLSYFLLGQVKATMGPSSTCSMTSKGQVTIPKALRQQLGLGRGSLVSFQLVGDHIEVRPCQPAAAMVGLVTNVLARYFVEEAQADAATQRQREAARQLIESGQNLFLPKIVALELEWMLRGYYGFRVEQVLLVFEQLLYHASCRDCDTVASFDDRAFARRIRQLNLPPRVLVP